MANAAKKDETARLALSSATICVIPLSEKSRMTPVLFKGYISCICMVRKNEGHMPKMLFLGGFTLALTKDLSLLCSTSHRGHFGFVGLSPPCDRKPHERKGHVCFLTILSEE